MRRVLPSLLLVLGVAACGSPDPGPAPSWRIELLDAKGARTPPPAQLPIVVFRAGQPPQLARGLGRLGPWRDAIEIEALEDGYYELWIGGHRPVRIDGPPEGPVRLTRGFPIDVTWSDKASIPEGQHVQVQARWRGPGEHPEALLRASLLGSGPEPGSRSWSWIGFVKGVLLDAETPSARIYVPWPGPYRLEWSVGHFRIEEGPYSFSASGGGSRSPNDGVAVEIPADGTPPSVRLPGPR